MKLLFLGGSGSLGNKYIELLKDKYQITVYSRDERKHWEMGLKFKNINYIIGNINDREKIRQTLIRNNFNIIVIASAMKHVDKCEYEINESLNTNLLGIKTVLDEVENNLTVLTNLKKVLFVSSDKACSPVNVYGMCKAISEKLMIEKSNYINNIKFLIIRYGNVLNSNGSIIPILHKIGNDKSKENFNLTHQDMTRFVMTLEQSVELIEYALEFGESGDIIIPKLVSCKIKDLLEIFSEKYNKPIKITGLRPGEKLLESLINVTQSQNILIKEDGHSIIKPDYKNYYNYENMRDYNSSINPLNEKELNILLKKYNLI